MQSVINELKTKTIEWIEWQDNNSELGLLFPYDEHDERVSVMEDITSSPFWLYRMCIRYDDGDHANFEDINEIVRADYANSFRITRIGFDWPSVMNSKHLYLNLFVYPKQTFWKQSQQEIFINNLLIIRNKIPHDIMNEIISYI